MPWFLLLSAAVLVIVVSWPSARRVYGLVTAAGLACMAGLAWPGRFWAEKMLTDLALPVGLIWFLLLTTLGWSIVVRGKKLAAWSASLCLALSAAGNQDFATMLTASLERPYRAADPLDSGEFDAVFLLGGGTAIDHLGRPKLNSSGDRVVLAARLVRAGRCELLVCTGNDVRYAEDLPTAAEMSASVLVDLGIPRETLLLAGGENTATEIASIRRLVEDRGWHRIGIVTSAWHMSRVERLAGNSGVEFVPLPADFRSGTKGDLPFRDKVRRFSLVPGAGEIEMTHLAIKEYLARLAGR